MIHLLFTGGTISMQRDPAAGGNVPAHGGEALVRFATGLEAVSPFRIENWARVPACHLGPDRLWALRERVCEIAESGEVRGIVITHGTDTIEETAYLLGRTLPTEVPIAITGAMRTSSDAGWDGPQNLLDAAQVAARPESAGRGTMVVFHGRVFRGETAVKTHGGSGRNRRRQTGSEWRLSRGRAGRKRNDGRGVGRERNGICPSSNRSEAPSRPDCRPTGSGPSVRAP